MTDELTTGECLICGRIELIQRGQNPYLVKELTAGYVVLGDHQFYKGYTLLLAKRHVAELHMLDADVRRQFLDEMAMVGKAVWRAFGPAKLNYEILGNADPHLHAHIFPRHADDPDPLKPVWSVPEALRKSADAKPAPEELQMLKEKLLPALLYCLRSIPR